MTYADLEKQIQALLKTAEPLRLLDDDDPRTAELADIVNQINGLRAKQSKLTQEADLAALNAPDDGEPMDRGYLERKAADLGIAFRANLSSAKLAERIAEATK
jgi:pyridoxine/pyridoxamine 5'-phosphate oxidase